MKRKGMLIVIDGTDGSGKATQAELLFNNLKELGCDVRLLDFPRYGHRSAVLVEDYLNGKFGTAKEVGPYRASIFYACDRYVASVEEIKKGLEEGCIYISNRYVSANQGHQAGKIKNIEERNKFLEWLDNIEYNIFGIPHPDINILLYVPPEIGQKLVDNKKSRSYVGGKKRDLHEADIEHLKDAAEAYLYVAKKYGWIVIDCAPDNTLLSIEQIHELVWNAVKKYV